MNVSLLLTSLATLFSLSSGQGDGTFREEYAEYATTLREDLLRRYDAAVPPRSRRDVELQQGRDRRRDGDSHVQGRGGGFLARADAPEGLGAAGLE